MGPIQDVVVDEELIRRLPLPLAQLYRRAVNAKSPLDRHVAAFYLWEAAIKLLGAVAVVEYAAQPNHDPALAECLKNLVRPALGHWWEFVRRLVPVLAEQGDHAFRKVRDLLLGRTRDDSPRAAALESALRQVLDGESAARGNVRLNELFDLLVRYRNYQIGHGAAGERDDTFYERMGRALLAAFTELMDKVDLLASQRLVFLSEVRQVGGVWLASRYELIGEGPRRLLSLEWRREEANSVPDGERVYLENPSAEAGQGALVSLHPLVLFDAVYEAETAEAIREAARIAGLPADVIIELSGELRPEAFVA